MTSNSKRKPVNNMQFKYSESSEIHGDSIMLKIMLKIMLNIRSRVTRKSNKD